MSALKRVGFIGLGMMGVPMTARLLSAGIEVLGSDQDPAKLAEFSRQPNASALTPASAAGLDALITMLPNSAVVESVLLKDGWAARLAPGSIVIDMSSAEPQRSRVLGQTLEGMGLQYIDAPVSGGVKRARDGSLAILVGGKAEVLERCRTLLAAMGSSILHIGIAGAGHAAKALNNYVSAAGIVATVEALHIGARFGIDPKVMTDVLNASSGRTNTSENKVKQFMLSGKFDSGFALQLMNKDIKIAAALGQAEGYPMRLGERVIELWGEAAQHADPTTDHTEMYRLLGEHGR